MELQYVCVVVPQNYICWSWMMTISNIKWAKMRMDHVVAVSEVIFEVTLLWIAAGSSPKMEQNKMMKKKHIVSTLFLSNESHFVLKHLCSSRMSEYWENVLSWVFQIKSTNMIILSLYIDFTKYLPYVPILWNWSPVTTLCSHHPFVRKQCTKGEFKWYHKNVLLPAFYLTMKESQNYC